MTDRYTIQQVADAFGKNVKVDETTTMLETCPFCRSKWTFRFLGSSGICECSFCGDGVMDWEQFVAKIKKDYALRDKLAQINKPTPPEGLIVVSEYQKPPEGNRVGTGFSKLDMKIGGLEESMVTILTGKQGEGKSTFASQMALASIENGVGVCFYSGELNARMFQDWIYSQAAGANWCEEYQDKYGTPRYRATEFAAGRIGSWLGKKLILYDNTIVRSSERNAIMDRFRLAHQEYGCGVYFVDNLMTAKYEIEQDYWRAQSHFVGQLVDFAHNNRVHIVLIAHPRKSESGDVNDDVAGSGDVTRRASNILRIAKVNGDEREPHDGNAYVNITKNREFGSTGYIDLNFDYRSRRLIPTKTSGSAILRYGWEDLV
jgi:twinkle protein